MPKYVPSPALCVATLALVASTGGIGYAAAKIATADILNGAVTTDKIADKTIRTTDLAPGTITALRGSQGAAGSAKAYADVATSGRLLHSKGVTAVTRSTMNIGVFCVNLASGISGAVAVVGVDYSNSVGSNLAAYFGSVPTTGGCPAATDFAVRTFAFAAGGNNDPSNSVAFTFMVP